MLLKAGSFYFRTPRIGPLGGCWSIDYFEAVSNEPTNNAVNKTIAVIASTMRSGSTLLKALLGEAADISHLPEVNFQRYVGKPNAAEEIGKLSPLPIVLLKKPAWYFEVSSYPTLPDVENLKVIVLVRDCYETVRSLRRMTFGPLAGMMAAFSNGYFVKNYWAGVTANLLAISQKLGKQAHLIRYEDVLAQPIENTKAIYEFLGSSETDGIDSYSPPKKFRWSWGTDDASDRIRSLQVQAPRDHGYADKKLLETIRNCEEVQALRNELGYREL